MRKGAREEMTTYMHGGLGPYRPSLRKMAWVLLRPEKRFPRAMRPQHQPPMPDARRYRHSRIPN